MLLLWQLDAACWLLLRLQQLRRDEWLQLKVHTQMPRAIARGICCLDAAAEMPNVYVVDTAAIPRNTVDYIHLGPEGQLQLGKSLGDAFLRVAKK